MEEDKVLDTDDGGWLSRKLAVTLICIALISAGAILSIAYASFAGLYATFIGGILGAAGLYFTGNVTNRFLSGKVNASVKVAKIKRKKIVASAADLDHNGD